ncbi:unnamed protein product, partial [Darwinula stevensoni]
PDQTLQTLVYKLVPGLYQTEMRRRRQYYSEHPQHEPPLSPEARGEVVDGRYISPDEPVSLSIEYLEPHSEEKKEDETTAEAEDENKKEEDNTEDEEEEEESLNGSRRRYLRCPAALSIAQLKKFIRVKYGLQLDHPVDILYRGDCLAEDYTLVDIVYIYRWKRARPMRFLYQIHQRPFKEKKRTKKQLKRKREPSTEADPQDEKDKKSQRQDNREGERKEDSRENGTQDEDEEKDSGHEEIEEEEEVEKMNDVTNSEEKEGEERKRKRETDTTGQEEEEECGKKVRRVEEEEEREEQTEGGRKEKTEERKEEEEVNKLRQVRIVRRTGTSDPQSQSPKSLTPSHSHPEDSKEPVRPKEKPEETQKKEEGEKEKSKGGKEQEKVEQGKPGEGGKEKKEEEQPGKKSEEKEKEPSSKGDDEGSLGAPLDLSHKAKGKLPVLPPPSTGKKKEREWENLMTLSKAAGSLARAPPTRDHSVNTFLNNIKYKLPNATSIHSVTRPPTTTPSSNETNSSPPSPLKAGPPRPSSNSASPTANGNATGPSTKVQTSIPCVPTRPTLTGSRTNLLNFKSKSPIHIRIQEMIRQQQLRNAEQKQQQQQQLLQQQHLRNFTSPSVSISKIPNASVRTIPNPSLLRHKNSNIPAPNHNYNHNQNRIHGGSSTGRMIPGLTPIAAAAFHAAALLQAKTRPD